jgi:ribose-phosphate pyrophosphokinase
MLGEELAVVCCQSGIPFGNNLIPELEKILRISSEKLLIKSHITEFACTDLLPKLDDSVRGKHVVVVADIDNHSEGRTNSQNFDELTQMISTARQVSAERLTVLVPAQPYSRQDKAQGREPISCALKEREIERAGSPILREIFHFDVHNKASTGFTVEVPIIPLYASRVLIPYIKENWDLENSMYFSCDLSRAPLARFYAGQTNLPFGVVFKLRDYSQPNTSDVVGVLGEPNGKKPILVDDMIDTGGTMIHPADLLYELTKKPVRCIHVHSLFNVKKLKDGSLFDPVEEFRKRYNEGRIEYVLGTDTVYNGRVDLLKEPWYRQVSVAPLAAEIIATTHRGGSISDYLE